MPAGVTDVFVAKLSAQGQWQWASRSVGAAGGSSQGLGLALDPATGDLALAASFKGTFGFGTTTLTDASGGSFTDGVVARLGSAGQWRPGAATGRRGPRPLPTSATAPR